MQRPDRLDNVSAQNIRDILGAAARLSRAKVCLYDTSGYLAGVGKAKPEDFDLQRHTCDFCFAVRALPGGRETCILSDVYEGVELAFANRAPVFHTCHAGLTEIIVPILYEDKLLGTAFCGQCRIEGETSAYAVLQKLAHFGCKQDELRRHFEALPLLERRALRDTATLLDHAFRHLVREFGATALKEYFTYNRRSLAENARAYIGERFFDALTVKQVASHLHITPAHLTRVFKNEVGENISDYIHRQRIEKACELLAYPNIPIGSIAVNVGYPDQNYFSRRFKQYTGCSPRAFRQQMNTSKSC